MSRVKSSRALVISAITSAITELRQFLKNGKKETYGPNPDFWRAPTDNDFGAGTQKKWRAWRPPYAFKTSVSKTEKQDLGILDFIISRKITEGKLNGFRQTSIFHYKGNGNFIIENQVDMPDSLPPLFRLGDHWKLESSYDSLEYWGRGPMETYCDRKSTGTVSFFKTLARGTLFVNNFLQSFNSGELLTGLETNGDQNCFKLGQRCEIWYKEN